MSIWKKTLNGIASFLLLIITLAGSLKETPGFLIWAYKLFPIQVWIILLSISLLPFGYYLYRKSNLVRWLIYGKDKRVRIAILLPMNHDDDFVREDAELQLQGFGRTLPEIREDLKCYDLKFIDHQNNPFIAKELIIKELKSGTKYFLSTMSNVCTELSKEFPDLDIKYGNGQSVLICTVAGANEIKTLKNKVYRFYINLKDEIQNLIENIDKSKNKASIIFFNTSPYARACSDLFKDKWNEKKSQEYHIDDGNTIQLKVNKFSEIGSIIINKKKVIEDKEVIFIVAYGRAYLEILQSLQNINTSALIVMTSTFSFKHWENKIMAILNNFEWLSCKPVLKDGEVFRDETDVVAYFSMNTLERIIQVIKNIKGDTNQFHREWNKCKIPGKLKYSEIPGKEGDYKIELTTKRKY